MSDTTQFFSLVPRPLPPFQWPGDEASNFYERSFFPIADHVILL